MRILPDTRDLINLTERAIPATPQAFGEYVRTRNHQIVLSFTNVRELAGPLARGGDFLQIRQILQSLEAMPHTYVKEVNIIGVELQSAVRAFNQGGEYQPVDVYVNRWDQTFMLPPGQQQAAYDMLVGLRLDDIVYNTFRVRLQIFAPPEEHLPRLIQQLHNDRNSLRAGQAPAREHFVRSVRRHADSHRVELPGGQEEAFARWVYGNPNRCPGLRLNHETYRQLMSNYGDVPEVGDFSDLAHVSAVPYVEAATLDNRMREYCSRAARRLLRLGATEDYRERLYTDLAELMANSP